MPLTPDVAKELKLVPRLGLLKLIQGKNEEIKIKIPPPTYIFWNFESFLRKLVSMVILSGIRIGGFGDSSSFSPHFEQKIFPFVFLVPHFEQNIDI